MPDDVSHSRIRILVREYLPRQLKEREKHSLLSIRWKVHGVILASNPQQLLREESRLDRRLG